MILNKKNFKSEQGGNKKKLFTCVIKMYEALKKSE